MSSPATLVEELIHNAKAASNRPLERRLADLSVWFYKNHHHIPKENLLARQAFTEKTLWCLIEINALLTERLHELEAGKRSKALWLPKGMLMNGDDE